MERVADLGREHPECEEVEALDRAQPEQDAEGEDPDGPEPVHEPAPTAPHRVASGAVSNDGSGSDGPLSGSRRSISRGGPRVRPARAAPCASGVSSSSPRTCG